MSPEGALVARRTCVVASGAATATRACATLRTSFSTAFGRFWNTAYPGGPLLAVYPPTGVDTLAPQREERGCPRKASALSHGGRR